MAAETEESKEQYNKLLDKYKLLLSEAQSFRTMLNNSTHFVFLLVTAAGVALKEMRSPIEQSSILLVSALGFLLLHFLHVVESHHYAANLATLRKVEDALALKFGGDEYWKLPPEPGISMQMRGFARHGIHLVPAIAAVVWWLSLYNLISVPWWQWLLLASLFCMFVYSLLGWLSLKSR